MPIIVLTILSLVFTAIVSSDDCECGYNLARNDFYGNQDCFTAYDNIENHLNNDTYSGTINEHINNMCTGRCGDVANRILHYKDRVTYYNRKVITLCYT